MDTVEMPVRVTIRSERAVKPYDFPATVTVDMLTVFSSDETLIDQLNGLKPFRQGVLNAAIHALRKTRYTNGEPPYASIMMFFGTDGKDGKHVISIRRNGHGAKLWSISSSRSDAYPDPTFIKLSDSLSGVLQILRDILEKQTMLWLSRVPVKAA